MTRFEVLTWQKHVAISGEHLAQRLANQLRETAHSPGYEVKKQDVENFLATDAIKEAFWRRLDSATEVSVQWDESAGDILAVAGHGIDTSDMAVDLDGEDDQENNAVEALTIKVRVHLFPLLEEMA